MLDNHDISDILAQYAKLYELHAGNPFKVKATASAAYNIKKIGEPLSAMSQEQLLNVPQIGKSIAPKVFEIIQTGSFADLDLLLEATPRGVQDILRIKGLGPKKVEVLWKTVGIASIPELLDACRENRLVETKGFGLKTQAQILSDIEFKFSNEGKFHWAKLGPIVDLLEKSLSESEFVQQFETAGDYRRFNDIVESIDVLLVCDDLQSLCDEISSAGFELIDCDETHYILKYAEVVTVNLYRTTFERWGNDLLEKTATSAHLELIGYNGLSGDFEDEESLYQALNLPYVLPELREGLQELEHLGQQDRLITFKDLKGVLHNHSTYSDGLHTLEEMAKHAKGMGLEYLGICDHSQTAIYANGLKPDRVLEQMREIDRLNEQLAPFRILKGIESDILADGSLDYTPDILSMFDMVVASVHSNLGMDMEKAHLRLKGAVENPYTSILGHPTGRLLLMRTGYPIDHRYIIDACIANGVAIELNAHPYRLDLDWRWIDYAVGKGGLISINPDAHQKEGLGDMKYGVNVARKGYLTPLNCLNTKNLADFISWLDLKKQKRS
jgi:DNA polymerase (family 10)